MPAFSARANTKAWVRSPSARMDSSSPRSSSSTEWCHGLPVSGVSQVGIIVVTTALFLASAVTGVTRGIKWLSSVNGVLALTLLAFVLVLASPDPGGVKRVLRWRETLVQRLQRPVGCLD